MQKNKSGLALSRQQALTIFLKHFVRFFVRQLIELFATPSDRRISRAVCRKKVPEAFTETRCRKRRFRDAVAVEGVRIGEGCPLPQPTSGSGERLELSSWVRGGAPTASAFPVLFECHRRL